MGTLCKISTFVEYAHGTTICANSGLISSVNEEGIANLEKKHGQQQKIGIHNYVFQLGFSFFL